MVDAINSNPTNWDSIVGALFRGNTNNTSSAALPETNVRQNNPQTFQWIGTSYNADLRAPIQKEQTQNPALDWSRGSAGLGLSYAQPTVTDIPTVLSGIQPAPSIAFTNEASAIGSVVQSIPGTINTGNMQNASGGYGMNPTDAAHWFSYFANQLGTRHLLPTANPASVLTAVQAQANQVTDGNVDTGAPLLNKIGAAQMKGYQPMQSFFGASRIPGLS